jgi:endopeptidase La
MNKNLDVNKIDKKNKIYKCVLLYFDKITLLNDHLNNMFKNKFIVQEFYIENMYILNDLHNKISNLESLSLKKKITKSVIDNLIKKINDELESITLNIGSKTCKNVLDIFINYNDFIENKSLEYKELFNLYNNYFIPLSCKIVKDIDIFIKKYNIKDNNSLIVYKLIDFSKNNHLIEKINGASIIVQVNDKLIIYINGYFNKDSLNIFKNYCNYKEKINLINDKAELIEIQNDFKERYLEQISLRDFIINSPDEIINNLKSDYNDFLYFKNKSLSALIKEFIKSNIEKQRKIIILFLLSEQEYQFTAHIIFDLISDKSFLSDSQYLSEVLFDSLHWKIQKIFKITNENFENNKKKLESITISNIPYESRILTIKVSDNIKAKAMEKLKEINGSKDNSIKAQQWLDGFLKIPFNIYKTEPIINFFKEYQTKLEKFIEIFTIKMSEYIIEDFDNKNKIIYDIIIQIIDEYHSTITNSENSYNIFIQYLKNIKNTIEIELDITNNNFNLNSLLLSDDLILNENLNSDELYKKENSVNECMKQLEYLKKIKNEIYENEIINNNNIDTMVNKLNDLESILNINIINENKEEIYINNDINNDTNNEYNINFKKYILKYLEELNIFINEWNEFNLKKKTYMKDIDKILDKCTYGQIDAKKQMKRIIGQWMNGTSKGQCFGLCGPPGVGKTTLCKNGLAKCLFDQNGESRPFAFLPLGGATNGSILEGHHYTYLGSTWGKIVDILIETKCMNPIIYIDELDKISKTEHGKEIASILTHITDQSQNKEFYDRYFSSIPIDLSQVLFIFSYNDRDNIDRILRDRIQEITIRPLSLQEKIIISQNYIFPDILKNVGYSISEIIFSNNILTRIINQYTYEAGVRKLNEILYDIVRDINLKKIEDINNLLEYPITINDNLIDDILSNIPKISSKKIDGISRVGIVNGLYATTSGLGGLTVIQVMKTMSDKKLSLEKLTGSQGDVMKESMNCALTLSWNILPEEFKNKLNENKDGFGLHIHCPECSTPKDGPSAGLAITTAIISRLTNIPIRNDVAMTGEVDLLGNASEIGGLYSKIQGALNAGIKKILIPKDNEKDLDIIFKREDNEMNEMKKIKSLSNSNKILSFSNNVSNITLKHDNSIITKKIFRNEIDIYIVNNIFDILELALVDNNLVFNKNL